ncbi:hypothetical protein JCM3765_003047 [Sporobolomyces pararoseus]
MPSLLHRNHSASNLEKPQPAHTHAHTSTPAGTTNENGNVTNDSVAQPNGGLGGGGGGKAFVHQRPTVGEWFKTYYVDLLTMAAIGAISLGVYEADPAPTRSFPITFSDGQIVYPEVAYPLRKNIIPIWAAALIAFFVPFVSFSLVQIRVRNFEDFNTAVLGVLFSLINAACFQVFIKWLIGGLRPHFLAVCAPNITGVVGSGFQNIMFDRSVCTGDKNEINDSLESMPSGHSTAAWAGLLFLSLYLNGKLKIFADYRPQFWKMLAFFAPLLGAFLIAGSLTIDEYHHWYDVLIGSLIGSASALAAYRMSYASIWDFRFNHLPLPRSPPSLHSHPDSHHGLTALRFPYSLDSANYVSPFASQWRGHEGPKGAPGDAWTQGGATVGGGGGHFGGQGMQAV